MQSQCRAGSGLTCRSSPLGCFPTTQGPVRDQYMNPNRAHRKASFATAPAPCAAPTHDAEWGELGHPTPAAHSRLWCQADTTRRSPPATKGYIGLQKFAFVPTVSNSEPAALASLATRMRDEIEDLESMSGPSSAAPSIGYDGHDGQSVGRIVQLIGASSSGATSLARAPGRHGRAVRVHRLNSSACSRDGNSMTTRQRGCQSPSPGRS